MESVNNSRTIFVDTAFFKALFDPKDDFYKDAEKIWSNLALEKVKFVTTNFVSDESFTLIKLRCGKKMVNDFRHQLAKTIKIKLIRSLPQDEAAAWDWFLLDWSDLSFTDCVSFAVMKRLGLTEAATFDQHFAKAGFKITS